jgi:hypothetical protein
MCTCPFAAADSLLVAKDARVHLLPHRIEAEYGLQLPQSVLAEESPPLEKESGFAASL